MAPLALAVLTVQHEVVRLLLARGAEVWALHKVGEVFRHEYTVLHHAVLREEYLGIPIVKLLLEGADCGKGSKAIMAVLHWCEFQGWLEMAEVLRPLVTPDAAAHQLSGFLEEFRGSELYMCLQTFF
jgi:hypothetical protein